ncbi:TadE/TadG family type IV pilus assembly protein [Streptomyces sp. FIT100]|uniref:TadE/TadG family type IV pilus assembly protein n=1 Tax=Streptomyces sp. FIT100 TaxID=2837956 RepID=UPI0028BECB47|nr:TadE/TadG family type IV pilus assembly protein [Streptomyces sp. FIT100]
MHPFIRDRRERRGGRRRHHLRGRHHLRDRGLVALEFAGFLPLLLILGLCAIQLGVAAYTASQAGTASRAGARAETDDDFRTQGEYTARQAVSGWLQDDFQEFDYTPQTGSREVTVTVKIKIPSLLPGIADWGEAERSSTMPAD